MGGEKDSVGANYRLHYNGPFVVTELYDFVDHWMHKGHFAKEIKEQVQRHQNDGKEIRYVMEIWKQMDHHTHEVVRLGLFMKRVKDQVISLGKRKHHVQNGEVLLEIEGFREQYKLQEWQNKPYIYFFRGLLDRFWVKNLYERYHGEIRGDVSDLYDQLNQFFKDQKKKYSG